MLIPWVSGQFNYEGVTVTTGSKITDNSPLQENTVLNEIEYEVIYLTGDDDTNRSKISECSQNTNGNYRYVMTANWSIKQIPNFYGANVILDLNGYLLDAIGYQSVGSSGYLSLWSNRFEITDTSPGGRGEFSGNNPLAAVKSQLDLVISGGRISGFFHFHVKPNSLQFLGGYTKLSYWSPYGELKVPTNVIVADYLTVEGYYSGLPSEVKQYYDYAVSTSKLVSGAFNSVYGYAWKLSVTDLRQVVIPDNKTYYLWGRNEDGWYEDLKRVYVDGAWVAE